MQTIPEFTIKDLVIKPDEDYANYEGENRVFIVFVTVSPEMAKLNEGDNFLYEAETYRVVMRTPPDANHPKSVQSDAHDSRNFQSDANTSKTVQFNCLKENVKLP
jgi:hypothetical protein